MTTERLAERSAVLKSLSLALLLCLATPLAARAGDDDFAPAPEQAQVNGVAEIYRDVRQAASRGTLGDLASREWQVTYQGELPTEDNTAIWIEMTPVGAFQMTRVDARTFSAKLVDVRALTTSTGQLREMGVKVSRLTSWSGANLRTESDGMRTVLCTVTVSFRLTAGGEPIDIAALRPADYKINYPGRVVLLAGVRRADVSFMRRTDERARAELQLYDPEFRGWTSYVTDIPGCSPSNPSG